MHRSNNVCVINEQLSQASASSVNTPRTKSSTTHLKPCNMWMSAVTQTYRLPLLSLPVVPKNDLAQGPGRWGLQGTHPDVFSIYCILSKLIFFASIACPQVIDFFMCLDDDIGLGNRTLELVDTSCFCLDFCCCCFVFVSFFHNSSEPTYYWVKDIGSVSFTTTHHCITIFGKIN